MDAGLGPIRFGNDSVLNMRVDPSRDAEVTDQALKPRVLVVDDEKLIADTCAEILEGAGFHVRAAYDGLTALEMVAQFQPDYLLTDVLMPQMNGVELAIHVRKMLPTAKILLFSGQTGISDILYKGREEGYEFELVAKPIHPIRLIEHLQGQQR